MMGGRMPTGKRIELATGLWSFVMYNLGMNFKEGDKEPGKERFLITRTV